MSVYIKGIEMPDGENEILFLRIYPDGKVSIDMDLQCKQIATAVPVPTPHGDLIDRQKLMEDNKRLSYPTDGKYRSDRAWAVGFNAGAKHANEHAYYAPTIIEAEEGEQHDCF